MYICLYVLLLTSYYLYECMFQWTYMIAQFHSFFLELFVWLFQVEMNWTIAMLSMSLHVLLVFFLFLVFFENNFLSLWLWLYFFRFFYFSIILLFATNNSWIGWLLVVITGFFNCILFMGFIKFIEFLEVFFFWGAT